MKFFLLKYAHIANIDSDSDDEEEEEEEDDSRAVERRRRRLNERGSEAYAAIHAAPPAPAPARLLPPSSLHSPHHHCQSDMRIFVRPSVRPLPIPTCC